MSYPRRVVAGTTSMITRRTLRRTHLLRPDRELNQIFLYCLAVCSDRFGIQVHSSTVMSTHEHLIVTDTVGQLPRFTQELHRLTALAIKSLRKWEGALWDHEKPSVVELRTPTAVIEKMAYCIANPVAAGLVHKASQWPGINTAPEQLGRGSWTVKRPDMFFDKDNPQWPATATLTLTMPPNLERTDAEVRELVADEVKRLEAQAQVDIKAKRWKVLGPKVVQRLSPYERAKSWEPLRGRNPSFAVGRGQKEAFTAAVATLRAFRSAYREALEQWRLAVRDVVFPFGTWVISWAHSARTAPA
jgi:putative transposase